MTLLSLYLFLLMIIPAWLVYVPLGAAGAPSAILATVILCCYLLSWLHPALVPARGFQPIRRAAVIFGCVVIASYVSANRSPLPTLELNAADRAIISTCGWLGVLLLAADSIGSRERLNTLLRRLVTFAAVLSALAIIQFTIKLNLAAHIAIPGLGSLLGPGSDVGTRGQFTRPSATALSPIELATVLVMSLPIAIHQARFPPSDQSRRRWLPVVIISAGLPITLSRTAFTALAAVCIATLPTWPKRDRRMAYVAGLVGLVFCYLAIPGLLTTFRNLFFGTSNASRVSAYSSAAPFIAKHPWLGTGPGTFLPQTYFFTDNQYLNTLISTGIIGLLALLVLFAAGWFTARSARRATKDLAARDLAQSLAASGLAAVVGFTTLDAFAFPIVAGLTFLVIGCIGAAWRIIIHGPVSAPSRPRAAVRPPQVEFGSNSDPFGYSVLSTAPSASTAETLRPVAKSAPGLGTKIQAGARWSMLNAVVMRISGSLVSIFLARTVFGPAVWGLYAVSQVVLVLVLSANELGICAAIIRWDGDVRPVARTVLTLSVAISTVVYAGLYVASPTIARVLGSPAATNVIRVLCICVIIDAFAGVPMSLLKREFAQRQHMLVDSLNFVVSTGVMLALALTGHGAMSFAWGAVAGCTAALIASNVLAPGVLPGWNTRDARRLLRFGLPLAAASLLVMGVSNVDTAIVGATLGPVMLGYYALAFNISSWPLTVISQAASRVSFAGFSRVAGSRQRLANAFARALAVTMALTVPACVLLATLAEPLIHTVYGERWTPAASTLSLLAVLGILRVAYALVYDCLAAAGRRHLLMWLQALWLGELIPVLLIGARTHGIVGVGAGHVLVAASVVGPAFVWALARTNITARSIAFACMRPFVGGILCAAASLFVIHLAGKGLAALAAAVAAGLAVYIPVVYPMRVLLRSALPARAAPDAAVADQEEVSQRV